jgi:hypothetical protein
MNDKKILFPTARPWHANGTQIVGKSGRKTQYVADVSRDNGALIAQDNAAFIARACNAHDALLAVADAAHVIYSEMGTRLSPAAFDDLSEAAKTALHDALANWKKLSATA